VRIRTIDLLFMMRHVDEKSIDVRREIFLDLLKRGGGWLRSGADDFGLVTG